jgi:hypothetical protein
MTSDTVVNESTSVSSTASTQSESVGCTSTYGKYYKRLFLHCSESTIELQSRGALHVHILMPYLNQQVCHICDRPTVILTSTVTVSHWTMNMTFRRLTMLLYE